MTLNFTSWILCQTGPTSIGYQYDNLTDVLQVTGTVPAGWSWDLMVQCGSWWSKEVAWTSGFHF